MEADDRLFCEKSTVQMYCEGSHVLRRKHVIRPKGVLSLARVVFCHGHIPSP